MNSSWISFLKTPVILNVQLCCLAALKLPGNKLKGLKIELSNKNLLTYEFNYAFYWTKLDHPLAPKANGNEGNTPTWEDVAPILKI